MNQFAHTRLKIQRSQHCTTILMLILGCFLLSACSRSGVKTGVATTNENPSATVNLQNSGSELTTQLEQAIAQDLPKEIGVPIESVTCPKQNQLEAGKVFDCQAKISAGIFPVEVRVRNTSGQVTLKTRQILVLSEAEKLLQQSIKQRSGKEVKANCGGKVQLFKQVGQQFQCHLVATSGKTGTATIKVTKPEGKVEATWKL